MAELTRKPPTKIFIAAGAEFESTAGSRDKTNLRAFLNHLIKQKMFEPKLYLKMFLYLLNHPPKLAILHI